MTRPFLWRLRWETPRRLILVLSVPQEVKYVSSGRQPSAEATVLRLSSSRRDASIPILCRLDGLPNASHMARSAASAASGSTRVVAALSR